MQRVRVVTSIRIIRRLRDYTDSKIQTGITTAFWSKFPIHLCNRRNLRIKVLRCEHSKRDVPSQPATVVDSPEIQ